MSKKKLTKDNEQTFNVALDDIVTDNNAIVHASEEESTRPLLIDGVINVLTGYDDETAKTGPQFTPLKPKFPYTYEENNETKVGSRTVEDLIDAKMSAAASDSSSTINTTVVSIAEDTIDTKITTDNTLVFGTASTTAPGTQGLVPAPGQKTSSEEATKYLGNDGLWHELGGVIEDPICYLPVQDTNSPTVYDGTTKTPTWNSNFVVNKMTVAYDSGDRINAGTYNATFTPRTGYSWSDGTTETKTQTWVIEQQPINATTGIPTQSGTLTYNGSAQSPSWDNYDSTKLTVTATTYTATFTPTANYKWSDDAATKTANWSIAKATPAISLSESTKNVYVSEGGLITVTRDGDGVISAESSDTSVATVSVSDTTVNITGITDGTANISITVAVGTNYLAVTTPVVCNITVISATIFGITYAVAGGNVRGTNWKNVDNAGTVITIADSSRYPHN